MGTTVSAWKFLPLHLDGCILCDRRAERRGDGRFSSSVAFVNFVWSVDHCSQPTAAARCRHCSAHTMHTLRQQHEQEAHRRHHSTIPMLLRRTTLAVVALLAAVASPLTQTARAQQSPPFLVDSLMDKLAFFGPTLDDGDWRARPMTRIAGECTARSRCSADRAEARRSHPWPRSRLPLVSTPPQPLSPMRH